MSNISLPLGKSVLVPYGYYSDDINISVPSLKSQTSATATANDIWSGKTAWVNGSKITGTRTDSGTLVSKTFRTQILGSTSFYTWNGKRIYRCYIQVSNIGINPVYYYAYSDDKYIGCLLSGYNEGQISTYEYGEGMESLNGGFYCNSSGCKLPVGNVNRPSYRINITLVVFGTII